MKTYTIDTELGVYSICILEHIDVVKGINGKYIKAWWSNLREKLNWVYGTIRPRICLVCNKEMQYYDLHHCICSKQNVRGWDVDHKILIDTELNLIPLHNWCHIATPPTKDKCWEYQCEFYGENIMSEWYYSLPFKVLPRRF
jgi:hypothetical protein